MLEMYKLADILHKIFFSGIHKHVLVKHAWEKLDRLSTDSVLSWVY